MQHFRLAYCLLIEKLCLLPICSTSIWAYQVIKCSGLLRDAVFSPGSHFLPHYCWNWRLLRKAGWLLGAGRLLKAVSRGVGDRDVASALPSRWGAGSLARKNPASDRSLCGAGSTADTAATAGTGPWCVPTRAERPQRCPCPRLCPTGGAGLPAPPRWPLGLGKCLRHPHVPCSFRTVWLQVLSPCVTGPQGHLAGWKNLLVWSWVLDYIPSICTVRRKIRTCWSP